MGPAAPSPGTHIITIYDFSAEQVNGKSLALKTFKGQAMLSLNTESLCGVTPQLAGLQALHARYGDKGLVVLGFSCNQFGAQADRLRHTPPQNCVPTPQRDS